MSVFRRILIVACCVLITATMFEAWRLETFKKRARASLTRALSLPDRYHQIRVSRAMRLEAERFAVHRGHDVAFLMIEAAAIRISGNSSDACQKYLKALDLDRRPEIYLSLGQCYSESMKENEALEALTRAVLFSPNLLQNIDSLALRSRVQKAAREHEVELAPRNPASLEFTVDSSSLGFETHVRCLRNANGSLVIDWTDVLPVKDYRLTLSRSDGTSGSQWMQGSRLIIQNGVAIQSASVAPSGLKESKPGDCVQWPGPTLLSHR